MTGLHLAAQSGQAAAVETLLELGADPTIQDVIHGGTPAGWHAPAAITRWRTDAADE